MDKEVITTKGKRPAETTPEMALVLSETLTQEKIGIQWGISRQRVQQLIAKGRLDRALKLAKTNDEETLRRALRIAEENQNTADSLNE